MARKTFSLEEANAYLPQLESWLAELQRLREQLAVHTPAVENTITHAPGNGGSKAAGEFLLLLQQFNAIHTQITEIGCELKDLNLGLVDFPSYRDGVLVYLCWKRGEARLSKASGGNWRSAFPKTSGSSTPD